MTETDLQEIVLPVIAAVVTGAVIGFERELRAKSAGLKTHTLVCLGSTLLMIAGADQAEWHFRPFAGATVVADPTRMAHGILTGIGFLGAGVIFRQGSTVHGLTTAASLWMTAALGILYGTGLYVLAAVGLGATFLVLVAFRVFQLVIPDRIEVDLRLTCRDAAAPDEAAEVIRRLSVEGGPVSWTSADGLRVELATRAWLRRPSDALRLGAELHRIAGVAEVVIDPVGLKPQ